ncbi:hypothetical protein [Thalassotalea marina]
MMRTMFWVACSVLLLGCDSDDVEEFLDYDDGFNKNYYRVSNLTGEDIDVYIRSSDYDGDKRNPFKSKYRKLKQLSDGQQKEFSYRHNYTTQINIGASFSYDDANQTYQEYSVDYNRDYHLIVWQQGENLNHRFYKRRDNHKDDKITLRVISVVENGLLETPEGNFNMVRGDISEQFRIENCATSVFFNGVEVDLCDGDYGKSYLVILDDNRTLIVPEK